MLLIDLQYFPAVSFFSDSFRESNILFDSYDPYRKMSFRNRCLIAGANNIIGLSIPLEGGRQQTAPMKEIRVSRSEPWQVKHWRSIHSAYNRSPFFEHYEEELEKIYKNKTVWLQDWNRACLEWIKQKTGWPPEIGILTGSEPEAGTDPKTDTGKLKYTDRRNELLPKNYLTFAAPRYHQVFEDSLGFQANLSVLDLLFNTGPDAFSYLAKL